MSNANIARFTGASESYVRRLVGGSRSRNGSQAHQLAMIKARGLNKETWTQFRKTQTDFVQTYLPQYKFAMEKDFPSYMLPTDDAFGSSGSGVDFSGSWSQYEWLSERRIGIGPKITRMPAEDAVREGFKLISEKTGEVVPLTEVICSFDKTLDLHTWLKNTDFLNQLSNVIYFERVFGIGFFVMYFSEDDKDKGVLGVPYNKKEGYPKAFEAIPPSVAAPLDMWESKKLDKDPQKWTIRGGITGSHQIHFTRLRTFMSRPVINRWYGLSVWEPIWDSAIPYYQALIYLLRGFARWGNMLVKYTIDQEGDLDELYTKNADLVDEMKMNGIFIGPTGTTIDFASTELAAGLREMMEIWIEDMAAGTGIPVPIMMGRIVSSGLSGVGYLVAERYYWNMIKKIQVSFTDDVKAILKIAGFDLKNLRIDWTLSITKTDQQRLIDEGLQIENEMMKEKLIQETVMTDRVLSGEAFEQQGEGNQQQGQGQQKQQQQQSKSGNGGAKKLESESKKTQDFIINHNMQTDLLLETIRKRRANLMKEWYKPLGGANA